MAIVKFDFYQVEIVDSSMTFESLLASVPKPLDQRNQKVDDNYIRPQELVVNNHLWEGDFIKIRMGVVPIKADLSGKISSIPLNKTEGIGEETAFTYYNKTKVLVLQRNRYGVSATAFAKYFQELAGGEIVIVLHPILRTDAMKELARMKQVKKMRVRFAGTTNSALFKSDGYGVKGIVNVMKDFKAPYLEMTVSMGRTSGFLDLSSAIPFVKQLIGVSHGSDKAVDKIELTGTNDDDERTVLDLLEFKMVETVDVKASITRRLFYTERKAAVLDAWNSKKQEITDLLPK